MVVLGGRMFLVLLAALIGGAASQSIQAEQPTDWKHWATVKVSWTHPAPQEEDWIGAFLVDWPATYIKWQKVTASPDWAGGNGAVSFDLLNGRHSYHFNYYRGDDVLATSLPITPLGATPAQGHLALAPGAWDRVTLHYTTNDTSTAVPQVVRWGTQADALDSFTDAVTSESYTPQDFADCVGEVYAPLTESFANISNHSLRCGHSCYSDPTAQQLYLDPGSLHSATLTPLPAPGTTVYYAFGPKDSEDDTSMSPTYAFVAPRPPGHAGSFHFAYTADAGIGAVPEDEQGGATHNDPPLNGADTVYAALLKDPLTASDEFMVMNGDLSYARGWGWIWERYFDLIQPLATALPLMVTVGNHEIDSSANHELDMTGGDSGGECGVATLKRFPYLGPDVEKMWYSFDYGSVHVVMLSSEHPTAPQVAFFQNDLAQVNRSATPWVLALLHRPPFASVNKNSSISDELAAAWHPLFVEAGVDMVLAGHSHYYERLCAVETNVTCATNRDRPVYVVDGSAGAEWDPSVDPYPNPRDNPLSMYKDFSYWGYSRLFVSPQELTFKHYHTDGSMVDQVTLPAVDYDASK